MLSTGSFERGAYAKYRKVRNGLLIKSDLARRDFYTLMTWAGVPDECATTREQIAKVFESVWSRAWSDYYEQSA